MAKSYFYCYYLVQQQLDFDTWEDIFKSTDKKYASEVLQVYRKKYPNLKYRLARLF